MVFGARKAVWFGAVAWVGLMIVTMVRCNSTSPQSLEPTAQAFRNLSDSATYVGIEVCKTCHYNIYQTYIETGMGQSFGPSSQVRSDSKLDASSRLTDPHRNLQYHPYWSNDSLFLLEFRLGDRGDTTHQRVQYINYIIGSGQHTNSHIYNVNGYLYQAPFTYYTQEGTLDFPPGFEGGNNTRFSRKIGLECMSCHNALPEMHPGSENRFTQVPAGISCERCHGPGSIHVSEKMAGIIIDTAQATDYSIVNPAKLSPDLQIEICQRCHLQGNSVLEPDQNFYDFRPGMKLSDVMTVFLPRYEGGENQFIMASHADRMVQSECYIATDGGFNCISCHNPHVSVHATEAQQYNQSCLSCHQPDRDETSASSAGGSSAKIQLNKGCTESYEHRLQVNNNDCSACHMPPSSSIDIPHVTVHDHKIQIPSEDVSLQREEQPEALKRFLGLIAINNPNPSNRTRALGYLQQFEKFTPDPQFLDSAATYIERAGSPLDLVVYHAFLSEDHAAAAAAVHAVGLKSFINTYNSREMMNRDAWTVYRAGQCFAALGMNPAALRLYEHAWNLAPYQLEFRNKLAALYIRMGELQRGMQHLDTLVQQQPLFTDAWVNLGFAHMLMGNLEASLTASHKALRLDPDAVQALINAAGVHGMRGDWSSARKQLERAATLEPSHPDVIKGLQALKEMNN